MNELLDIYRLLPPSARRDLVFAFQIIDAAIKTSPDERLAEYEKRNALGVIDTTGFSREDFQRLSQIEQKVGQ